MVPQKLECPWTWKFKECAIYNLLSTVWKTQGEKKKENLTQMWQNVKGWGILSVGSML